jgi:hypothetical protein
MNGAEVVVGSVQAATNRFDLELQCSSAPERPAVVRWEDLQGWLAARLVDPGWMNDLPVETRARINVALSGLYKLAGVDLVREQVLLAVGREPHHGAEPCLELERDAIRLIPSNRQGSAPDAIVYSLQSEGPAIPPQTSRGGSSSDWPVVDRSQFLFRETELNWTEWVQQWPAPGTVRSQQSMLPDLLGVQ